MSKIAHLYSDEVKKNFEVFYANWEPGGPVELGDYGFMNGNIFIPHGKLKNDFTEFAGGMIQFSTDTTKDLKEFKSDGGVEVNLVPKGSVNMYGIAVVKASLDIRFSKTDSVYFHAADCTTTRISNKAKIGEVLKQLYKEGKWDNDYYVVTDLVQAGRTIIAISQDRNSGISFEAESPLIEKINLADAGIKLNISSEKSIGYKVDAEEGLDILLGLCKLRKSFIGGNVTFKARKLKMEESLQFIIEKDEEIGDEEDNDEDMDENQEDDDLVFEQMGKNQE